MSVHVDLGLSSSFCHFAGFPPTYGVDRSIPVSLANKVQEAEWDEFCSQVDGHVRPIAYLRAIIQLLAIAGIGVAVALMVIYVLGLSEENNVVLLAVLGGICLVEVLMVFAYRNGNQLKDKLLAVCEEATQRHSGSALHFQVQGGTTTTGTYTQLYIKITILDESNQNSIVHSKDALQTAGNIITTNHIEA